MQLASTPGDFQFRELTTNEKPTKGEVQVTKAHKEFIENLPEEERVQLWQNLKSRNRAAQKRAKRKMASASRSRNR